jgi:glutamate-1-semialdehyde aminotransferase
VITIGKAVAGGVPMGAYGVTSTLGHELSAARQVATGGRLFGNPLSAAAAKAALTEVLVADAYEHTDTLGAALADGIEAPVRGKRPALDGDPLRSPVRTVVRPAAADRRGGLLPPQRGADPVAAGLARQPRGVGGPAGAGPTVPVPAAAADVDRYLQAYAELLEQLTR